MEEVEGDWREEGEGSSNLGTFKGLFVGVMFIIGLFLLERRFGLPCDASCMVGVVVG